MRISDWSSDVCSSDLEIVSRALCQRPVLAVAGDPAIDQPRVALQADIGADAEPFGNPRPKAFDQHVGAIDQIEQDRDRTGLFEVEREAALAAIIGKEARLDLETAIVPALAPDVVTTLPATGT